MDSQIAVKPELRPETIKRISEAEAFASALVIAGTEDYLEADRFCKGCFTLRQIIKADFKDSREATKKAKDAAAAAYSTVVEQEESKTDRIIAVEKNIKAKMLAFSQSEERKRQAVEAAAREEARKRAEDEQLRKAEALEKQGKTAQAEAVLERPTKIAVVVLPPSTPKPETIIRKIVRYEILDADGVKREFCEPAAGKIRQAVNLYGEKAVDIVGGIRVWTEAA